MAVPALTAYVPLELSVKTSTGGDVGSAQALSHELEDSGYLFARSSGYRAARNWGMLDFRSWLASM